MKHNLFQLVLLIILLSLVSCGKDNKKAKPETIKTNPIITPVSEKNEKKNFITTCSKKLKENVKNMLYSFHDLKKIPQDNNVSLLNNAMKNGQITHGPVFLLTYNENNKLNEFSMQFEVELNNKTYSYDFTLEQDKESLTLRIDGAIFKDNIIIEQHEQKFKINSDCIPVFNSNEIETYSYIGKTNQVKIKQFEIFANNDMSTNELTTKKSSTEKLNIASNFNNFINVYSFFISKKESRFEVIDGLEKATFSVSSNEPKSIKCQDNFQNKITLCSNLVINISHSLYGHFEVSFSHSNDSDSYTYTLSGSFINFTKKRVTAYNWLNTSMQHIQDTRITINNFQKEDFENHNLSYTIKTKNKLTFDNYNRYFKLTTTNKINDYHIYAVDHGAYNPDHYFANSEQLLRDNNDSDLKYLVKTKYYNTELPEIISISKELLEDFPQDGTRLFMINKIQNKVLSILTYDYEMITFDSVRILTTKEIIDEKMGTCRNFTNLFVTIARSVGLPARGILGYYLEEDKATGHSWVEVKLDEEWYPLEPQENSLSIPLNFFPLGIDLRYEHQEQDLNHEGYDEILKLMTTKIIFDKK